jgi:hypothetical protein
MINQFSADRFPCLTIAATAIVLMTSSPSKATPAFVAHSAVNAITRTLPARPEGMIPINLSLSTTNVDGQATVTITVTVDSVPSDGGTVQIGCDTPSLASSPSATWPYSLSFPGGGATSQTLVITTENPTAITAVIIYASIAGVDSSNPANWAAEATLTVTPNPAISTLNRRTRTRTPCTDPSTSLITLCQAQSIPLLIVRNMGLFEHTERTDGNAMCFSDRTVLFVRRHAEMLASAKPRLVALLFVEAGQA